MSLFVKNPSKKVIVKRETVELDLTEFEPFEMTDPDLYCNNKIIPLREFKHKRIMDIKPISGIRSLGQYGHKEYFSVSPSDWYGKVVIEFIYAEEISPRRKYF